VPDAGKWIVLQCRLFFSALQFFTRLPIPAWVGFDEIWLQHIARFFPLTGAVVAAAITFVAWSAGLLLPQPVAVLLAISSGLLLTGAFHEDGFADVCDGFGGGANPARTLEIMKDSRVGAFGVLGIGMLLAIKCTALTSLPNKLMLASLFIAQPLSRLFANVLMWRLDYARTEGKAKPVARRMTHHEFAFAFLSVLILVILLLLAGLFSWQQIFSGILPSMVATAYLTRLFLRRIGGYTGDCLGAVQQVAETCFYLGILACSRAI